ncbi:MAG: FAD-dependent oxidoreductase [Paracoccaceae bacterium]
MAQHAAKHLIIGGGIIGCSIAYHLTRMGEKNVVLLERASLTEGATWHAAGLVGQLRSSRNTTRMLQKSVAMYDRLQNEEGMQFDWKKTGSLRLAATRDRMLEAKRLATMARSFDLDMQIISPNEAKDLFPLIDATGLEGAAFIPSDGYVDPASLCQAIASAARKQGADIRQNVETTDFAITNGRVTSVETFEGTWSAETVVIATGMWSRELGAKLGIRIPACAVEHQYIVTESTGGEIGHYPTLRDPERLVYYKPDVGGRLVIGGYEDNTIAFGNPRIPGQFVRQLLPENLDRFLPLAELAGRVTPVVYEIGIRQVINGPIPYSADGDFVMGWQPGFENLMLATGFLYGIAAGGGAGEMIAEWIVDGAPSLDLWPLDVRRFGPHHGTRAFMFPRAIEHYAHHYKMRYPGQEHETVRQLRLSPLYKRLKQAGAVYGSKNGWERPLWFAPKDVAPIDQLDFLDPGWTQFVAEEHRCVRERVALIDQTSFSKFDILGDGTCDALQKLCVSNMDKPKGAIIYTQMCNPEGGIEADITFIRLGPDHYRMITGSGFGVRDSDWLKRNLAHGIHVIDVTSSYAVLNLVGPKSRLVLEANSEDDVSNTMIPFAKARDIIVGAAPVLAARIGYVGELGYELHIPTEFAAHVYDLLWAAGQSHGIANVGYRAVEGLRMEKGYVYWSGDISPDYTPIEAGLGFRVHLNSKGDFIGRAALKQQIQDGPKRRLCTFVTDAPLPLTGGETILLGNQTVSLATSVGFGHTVGKTILRGYLEAAHWDQSAFTLEVFGEHHPITRISGPAYDPENKALKA